MSGTTKRDQMKRKLAQSVACLDSAMADIAPIFKEFENVHPDLAEGLTIAAELIIQAEETLYAFSERCWNTDRETLMRYRT